MKPQIGINLQAFTLVIYWIIGTIQTNMKAMAKAIKPSEIHQTPRLVEAILAIPIYLYAVLKTIFSLQIYQYMI